MVAQEEIREAAKRAAGSRTFARSEQLRGILLFICHEAAEGRTNPITETEIAERVLNRKNFDPSADTIVRVQFRRLRQKLEEYYLDEGAAEPLQIDIPKHSYLPLMRPAVPPGVPEGPPPPPAAPSAKARFWQGFSVAFLLMCAVLAAVVWLRPAAAGKAAPDWRNNPLASSPFWRGMAGAKVRIAIATPLFFHYPDGYVRDFHLNFHEDLAQQDKYVKEPFAMPVWKTWASFSDLEATVHLATLLRALGSEVSVASAQELAAGSQPETPLLVLGHPRASPFLLQALSDKPFYVKRGTPGDMIRGIINREPRIGEENDYMPPSSREASVISRIGENDPDYVLVSLLTSGGSKPTLSIFGNRYASAAFVVRQMTDPAWLGGMERRVYGNRRDSTAGCQVVLQIRYLNGRPVESQYAAHRLLER